MRASPEDRPDPLRVLNAREFLALKEAEDWYMRRVADFYDRLREKDEQIRALEKHLEDLRRLIG